jgi:hypothetical protein
VKTIEEKTARAKNAELPSLTSSGAVGCSVEASVSAGPPASAAVAAAGEVGEATAVELVAEIFSTASAGGTTALAFDGVADSAAAAAGALAAAPTELAALPPVGNCSPAALSCTAVAVTADGVLIVPCDWSVSVDEFDDEGRGDADSIVCKFVHWKLTTIGGVFLALAPCPRSTLGPDEARNRRRQSSARTESTADS